MAPLVRQLGYRPDDRLLIISAAGLGGCHAMNEGAYAALRDGLATTATLLVPCPWSREAAARFRGEDVGVALTLNAEFELYRWGPITYAPSLLDGNGGMPGTVTDVWDHADLDEVRRECRAQIERAILWGFDVTHLDSHLDVLSVRPEFFDVYLELAAEFGLPLRLIDTSAQPQLGFPAAELVAAEGVVTPDRMVRIAPGHSGRYRRIEQLLDSLEPGVTELQLQPAADLPELRSLTADWGSRVEDLMHLCGNAELRTHIERSGITMIGYRELRQLQRATSR
ncbi:polysaccharide deacetylase family protein [Candidatus Poriferisodalis sp.]|uniref:polysaccharide deacetylase family protein n=1 Tax=Candidatus Poriferisodalis sp. TaxID=3101277 RepID=UPI003D106CF4